MSERYIQEPHLMGNYFGLDSVTYRLIQSMRDGVLNGGVPRFREELLRAAKREIDRVMTKLDESAYPFARDLSHHVFDGQSRRMIALIEGAFVYKDGQTLESMIGVDLGTNPWQVFQDGNLHETIDSMATRYAVQQYFAAHRDELKGIKGFDVAKSHFLYLSDKAAAQLDMPDLVPLIKYTKRAGFTPVSVPSPVEYSEMLPLPLTSYRLKASLTGKLVDKLGLPRISRDDVIRDWAGHRVVVEDEGRARDLAQFLNGSPTIGSSDTSRIECIEYEDGYKLPEDSGFKTLKITARVTVTEGRPITTIRRIHILDRNEYYKSEVRPKGPANRLQFERKREQRIRSSGATNQSLIDAQEVLGKLFGKPTGLVEVI